MPMPTPPSTGSTTPEMYAAGSAATHTAAAATSSTEPYRLAGTLARISALRASVIWAVMSVSMKPGAMTLAVIDRPPSSRVIERASPIHPAVLAGDGAGQPDQSCLARGIVRLSRCAGERHDGGNEDHPPAAGLEHRWRRSLRYSPRTSQVRVQHPNKGLLAHAHQ